VCSSNLLTFNLGSSGKMAQQIQQGAPSDIFISANQDWMDRLEDDGDIDVNSRIDLTGNTIVLITANHSDIDIQSLSDIDEYDFDQIDRKSTRLNSSHVSISYAVFCLKK